MTSIPQGFIYFFHNAVSNKVYVGQTLSRPKQRRGEHLYRLRKGTHENKHLQASWKKYGEGAFGFYVLEEHCTLEDLNEAEIFYITYFRSVGISLYNCKKGGDHGGKHSEESKARMRGRVFSEEHRKKISIANSGRKASEETRAKMRAARASYRHSEATKAKIGAANARREISEETRTKLRAINSGKKSSAETRAKQSAATIGRPKSEETKARMRGKKYSLERLEQQRQGQLARYRRNYVLNLQRGRSFMRTT